MLYTQLVESKLPIHTFTPMCVSIANLYYMFDVEQIKKKVTRFNINYIPAFRIDTLDELSLIILNPIKNALDLLKDLLLERTYRLLLIIEELMELGIHINTKKWFNQIKPEFITEVHLSNKIIDLSLSNKIKNPDINQFGTTLSMYENVLKPVYNKVPLRKFESNIIFNNLKGNDIILANPEQQVKFINSPFINGIIQNPFLDKTIIDLALSNNKRILPGTGALI
jgi:hypothetical protein